jgi:hypothetical protein
LHPDQAARDQAPEEVGPERFGLGLADVDREDLATAALVHAMQKVVGSNPISRSL